MVLTYVCTSLYCVKAWKNVFWIYAVDTYNKLRGRNIRPYMKKSMNLDNDLLKFLEQ